MNKHATIYCEFFGFTEGDPIRCEVCTKPAVDIHHVFARGMGGNKKADRIDNLMALCRSCHEKYGDKTHWRPFLLRRHEYWMESYAKKP